MQQGQKFLGPLQRSVDQRRDTLLRVAIVIAVLVLSAVFALRTPGGRSAAILAALPLIAVGSFFLLRRPGLGLIILVVSGLVVPFSIGTGTGTTINPVVILVPALTALWIFDMIMRHRAIHLHHHGAIYLMFALCGVAVLALIVGQLPWYNMPGAGFSSQLGGLLVFIISAAAFFLSAHVLNEHWLKRLVNVFLAIAAIYLVTRLLPGFGFVQRLFTEGSTGSIFWIWTISLAGGMALFNDELKPNGRAGLAGLALVTLLISVVQARNWASGWVPSTTALLILIWLRFPRRGWIPILLVTIVAVTNREALVNLATDNQQWYARLQAWEIVLNAAMVNPLLGLGPSNYYFIVEQYSIAGWGGLWNIKFNSHNNFVDIIAQIGFVGLGIFLAFAAVMGSVGYKLYRRLPNGFARAYAAACIAGLIATLLSGMLGDWFLPFVYNIGMAGMRSSILFWVFMGGLLGVYISEFSPGPESQSK